MIIIIIIIIIINIIIIIVIINIINDNGYLEEYPLVGSSPFKTANYNKLSTALKIFYDNSKKNVTTSLQSIIMNN